MRRIGVVTVARSDYGVCRPLLRAIEAADDLELVLIAGGMHLDPALGDTIGEILADGFAPAARVPCSPEDDTPAGLARAMGRGTAGFAAAYEELGLDLLVVLGDRFEMHAAALAAQPFLIPVAHIDGGALTTGAIDDALRHSMTKLASLHFVENEPYRDRVVQMGELPERVSASTT
jgi:UDP-hydrolysing UDP-N-acetyl-D-glucosamine 2-epimerase